MRVKALSLVVSLGMFAACASARPQRGEEVGGIFDEEEGYSGGGGGGGRYAAASAPSAPNDDAGESIVLQESISATTGMTRAIDGLFGGGNKDAEAPPPGPPPPPPAKPVPTNDETSTKAAESSEGAKPGRRMVIYTGSMTVLVTNVTESLDKLQLRVESAGGYVQNRTGNSSSNNGAITIRIPVEEFHKLVKELAGYGQLINEQITANDVTKQMFDIELRLETAEKSRARLVDLLKTATKMEEILQIENEIRRLTQEIEGMKGELRYLKDQVAFSTLTVTFYSHAPPPTPGLHRTRSRFEWINQVGVERVLGEF